ncbi:glucose-1-phosphate thymidylyltransferase RfbA [Olsenella uli]|uniref:glucose-1-phosphate thymidylyltransferase RfbA n=1 Tax=Olsenella uli TaxID=133926 RepID=UPI0012ABBB9D|nr:glucose-1-phosphate thymidylyltransferase RfbA [Olsenella uli]
MKGIVLAGGFGTHLYPMTFSGSKHLLPIYDKPLVYYALSTLMRADIRDVLFITNPQDLPSFEAHFGDGSQLGMNIQYKAQESRDGIAQAFLLGEDFIDGDRVALVLADSIFYGSGFDANLSEAINRKKGATVFAYQVRHPENYAVVDFGDDKKVTYIEEKPEEARTNYVATGLYVYDENVVEYAKKLRPSARGELEITDLNQMYLDHKKLFATTLPEGFAWFSPRTVDDLFHAGEFVRVVQQSTGTKIASIEEIAYKKGWIGRAQLLSLASKIQKTEYGKYLEAIALSTSK